MSSPDNQVAALQAILSKKMDEIFPQEKVKISIKDKSYITAELTKLDRLKKREYKKHGKSEKWVKLQSKFAIKLKKAAADHLDKNCHSLNPISPVLWKHGNYPWGGPQHHPLENGFGASVDP